MKMPPSLQPFLSLVEWKNLALGDLDGDDRKNVLDLLLAAFDEEDPAKVSRKDIAEVLRRVKALADDFRRCADDDGQVSRNDSIAGEQTAREVLRELYPGRKKRGTGR